MSAIMSATADFGHGPADSGAVGGLATATRFLSRDSVSCLDVRCDGQANVHPSPVTGQYSSANMIVMTRSVTVGSAGSGE